MFKNISTMSMSMSEQKSYYVMRRRGHFLSSNVINSPEWCKSLEHNTFQYTVNIISPSVVDGILIHHERIVESINSATPQGSCEDMSSRIVNIVKDLLEKSNAAWNIIQVRLFACDLDNMATPKANMECVTYKGNQSVLLLPLLNSDRYA